MGNWSAVKACNYKSLHSQPCYGRYYNCISQTVVLMEVARGCTSPKRPRRGSQVDGCVEKHCLSHCSSHQLLFKLWWRRFCDLSFAVSSFHQWTLDIFRRIRFGYSSRLLFLTCSSQKKGSICSWWWAQCSLGEGVVSVDHWHLLASEYLLRYLYIDTM